MADDALAPRTGSTADDGRAPLMPAAVAAALLARAAATVDAAEAPDKTHDETVAELERAAGNAAQHGMPPGTRAAVDRMKGKWQVVPLRRRVRRAPGVCKPAVGRVRAEVRCVHVQEPRAVERC